MQAVKIFTINNVQSLTSVECVDISNESSTKLYRSESKETDPDCDKNDFEKSKDFSKSPFYEAYTPIIFCLKLSGLYFVKSKDRLISPQQVYCYILSLCPFVGIAMEFSLFRFMTSLDVNFLTLLVCSSFTLLCAANAISFLRHAHNPKYFRKYIIGFDSLKLFGGPYTQPDQIRKLAKYTALISFICYCLALCTVSYAIFMTELFNFFVQGFNLESTNSFMKIFLTMGFGVFGLQWTFPNCVSLCVGIHIYLEYKQFFKAFKRRLHAHLRLLQTSIEIDRQRFVQMTRIVEAADKILALHFGVSFATTVACFCLNLYMVAYYSKSAQVGIVTAFLMQCVVNTVVNCASGILINTAVRFSIFFK